MAVNQYSNLSSDVVAYLEEKLLQLPIRQLVAYQFGVPLTLPKGRGLSYTASRWNRVPLPYAPISEGVPPLGQSMIISQVTCTAQQWADGIILTDVAEMTVFHPPFQQAVELCGMAVAETLERNTMNTLLSGAQVNYVNTRGSRAALMAGDVLDTQTVIRTYAALNTLGAPRFNGDERTDMKIDAQGAGATASSNPRKNPHYVALIHPLVSADFRQNSNVDNAWSRSDVNRLYNAEVGEWSGVRFCETNMIPSFTGVAQVNGTLSGGGGTLPAAANYYIIVTASDTQNQYESRIYQVSAAMTTNVANGSIAVALPNLSGFTFSVYVGTNTSPSNLGVCAAGPATGPQAGQATQMAGNQTVVITGVGAAQTPPSAPATGLIVYPTFVIGRTAYGQVVLDDVKVEYLTKADKSDPWNQKRIVSWKVFYSSLIQNQLFLARIESVSANAATFG
jgi:N4-gp56 family major capsid protein